ncbi:MAG: hypothetical protein ACTSPI_12165, partial [Candidatus Heimdallarchaeaceae archaeon]
MRFLEVHEDGSLEELQDLVLNPEAVLIVVDEEDKRMWLWKGRSCRIRKKFIGSRALSDLRKKEYGFAYIPQTCEQDDETAEFVSMLQKIGKEDLVNQEVLQKAKEIMERQSKINVFDDIEREPHKLTERMEVDESIQLKERPSQVPQSKLPSTFAKMGAPGNRPVPTILSALDGIEEEESAVSKDQPPTPQKTIDTKIEDKKRAATTLKKQTEELLKKSFDILQDLGVPKGFYRDLIIIGTSVYTESYDGSFEELDEPPEGVFFSRSHVPRMICENGI